MTIDEIEDKILEIQDDLFFAYKQCYIRGEISEEEYIEIDKKCELEIKKLKKTKPKK